MQLSTGPAIASSLVLRQDRTHMGRLEPYRDGSPEGPRGSLWREPDFSPDGSRVITAARDGTARIWDAASGEQHFVLRPVGDFPTAVFDTKGNRVLTAGDNSSASLWDARTGTKILSVGTTALRFGWLASVRMVAALQPHKNGRFLSGTPRMARWLRNGRLAPGPIHRSTFSPDGSRLLIGSWGTISHGNFSALWNVSKGTQIAKLEGHKSDTQLQGVTFSHDGRRIATVSLDGSARLWDGESGRLLDVLGQESPGLKLQDVASDERDQEMNAAFSRDDRFLATTSFDGTTRIWDVNHASLYATIVGQGPLIEHLEFSPVDTNILLTASHDGTARLWDVDGILTTVLPHKSSPTFAVFSPDNLHLLTGGGDAAVHLWDVATGREIAELDTHEITRSATFSPDGSRLATASLKGQILIWDVASRREVARLTSGRGLLQVRFSPKGDLLMSASAQGMTQLWDAATGAEVTAITTSAKLPQVVFSRGGDLLLAATSDNAAHVMKTDGTELKVLVGHQSKITSADFSPDGQLVATASLDRTARIWSVNDGSTVATLKGHSDELTAVAFSSDGQSLLTSSRDGTVRIWSVSGGSEKAVLRGHSSVVTSAQFSPSGLYIVTASFQDRTVRLWATQSGRQIAVLAGEGEAAKPSDIETCGFQFGWSEDRNRRR